MDRDRPQHGGEQAGRPEAVRARRPDWTRRRVSTASPTRPGKCWSARRTQAAGPGSAEILPGHLVLGLLAVEPEGGGAAGPVAAQGVAGRRRRPGRCAALPARPPARCPPLVPFDARARKVLELTFRRGAAAGHDGVGTGHILLALLEEEAPDGLLAGLGVTGDGVEPDERLAAMPGS